MGSAVAWDGPPEARMPEVISDRDNPIFIVPEGDAETHTPVISGPPDMDHLRPDRDDRRETVIIIPSGVPPGDAALADAVFQGFAMGSSVAWDGPPEARMPEVISDRDNPILIVPEGDAETHTPVLPGPPDMDYLRPDRDYRRETTIIIPPGVPPGDAALADVVFQGFALASAQAAPMMVIQGQRGPPDRDYVEASLEPKPDDEDVN